MNRLALALAVLLIAGLFPHAAASGARTAPLPSKATWTQDVKSAMFGSQRYLKQRVAARSAGETLAVVLDIDNTSIATKYAWPRPVRTTRAFAQYAVKKQVNVFFVTGRSGRQMHGIRRVLRTAGYTFAGVCGRKVGVRVAASKIACRRAITARGFTITANIGNNSKDFRGGNYERAFMLPNYENALL